MVPEKDSLARSAPRELHHAERDRRAPHAALPEVETPAVARVERDGQHRQPRLRELRLHVVLRHESAGGPWPASDGAERARAHKVAPAAAQPSHRDGRGCPAGARRGALRAHGAARVAAPKGRARRHLHPQRFAGSLRANVENLLPARGGRLRFPRASS